MDTRSNLSTQKVVVSSIESLRQPIADADVEIVQLGKGQLTGSLTKTVLERLAFSKTNFSLPLRTTGSLGTANLTICMLLNSEGASSSWARELNNGDVFFTSPGKNFDALFGARSEVAGISIHPDDIAAAFPDEPILANVAFWTQNHQFACDPALRQAVTVRVRAISSMLESYDMLSSEGANFWQRCLIEAFTSPFINALSDDRPHVPSALRIVRDAEDYLDRHAHRAVHVSELCVHLHISRRSLHRAFHDILGIGPIAFLRHRRLCSTHTRLLHARSSHVRVTDIATEFGFLELGRFSHYYATLFGESPSQTLSRTSETIDFPVKGQA